MCSDMPFYKLFVGLFEQPKNTNLRKSDKQIDAIIRSYDEEEDGFKIGRNNKVVKLTPKDIKTIFEINCGTERLPQKPDGAIMRKYFSNIKELQCNHVVNGIKEALEGKLKADFCKLLTILAIGSVFFPRKGASIPLQYLGLVDNLSSLTKYDWVTEIHSVLMESIKENYKRHPERVTGCTIGLQVWFQEIAGKKKKLIRPNAHPRCLRWRLGDRKVEHMETIANKNVKDEVELTFTEMVEFGMTPEAEAKGETKKATKGVEKKGKKVEKEEKLSAEKRETRSKKINDPVVIAQRQTKTKLVKTEKDKQKEKAKNKELTQEVKSLELINFKLNGDVKRLQTEVSDLKKVSKGQEIEIKDLKKENAQLQARIQELEEQLKESLTAYEELEDKTGDYDSLKQEYEKLNNMFNDNFADDTIQKKSELKTSEADEKLYEVQLSEELDTLPPTAQQVHKALEMDVAIEEQLEIKRSDELPSFDLSIDDSVISQEAAIQTIIDIANQYKDAETGEKALEAKAEELMEKGLESVPCTPPRKIEPEALEKEEEKQKTVNSKVQRIKNRPDRMKTAKAIEAAAADAAKEKKEPEKGKKRKATTAEGTEDEQKKQKKQKAGKEKIEEKMEQKKRKGPFTDEGRIVIALLEAEDKNEIR